MALNCGANNFLAGAGGGAVNANIILAIVEAFLRFIRQLLITLQQAQAFVNQPCPGQCPNKAVVGPTVGNTRFSLRFNPRRRTWQAGFTCAVRARVNCRKAAGAKKPVAARSRRRAA
jgi:hypothetical protein